MDCIEFNTTDSLTNTIELFVFCSLLMMMPMKIDEEDCHASHPVPEVHHAPLSSCFITANTWNWQIDEYAEMDHRRDMIKNM